MTRSLSNWIAAMGVALLALAALPMTSPATAKTLVKVGHDQPEKSPHHQAAVKWKELVEKRSNGEVQVQLFPSNLLGSGTQMVEQLQAGALEVAILPTGWVAPLAPSVSVLDLPFLFPSRKIAYQVIDGPVGADILKPLNKVNIEGVAFWESGFKQFTGDFPIRTPGDYKGHKIRTMPAPVIQEQFKAFGATPTAIDFKELYMALQQKVVDGQENPIATIASMRFFEVQKHMTLSDHGFLAYIFMFNKAFLDKQPENIRKILVDAAIEARDYERDIIAKAEKSHLETFRKAGMEIAELNAEQRAAFKKASQQVYDWWGEKNDSQMLDKIRSEVDTLAGK